MPVVDVHIEHLLKRRRRHLLVFAVSSCLVVLVCLVSLAATHGDVGVVSTLVGVSGRHLLFEGCVEAVDDVNADLLLLLNLFVFGC